MESMILTEIGANLEISPMYLPLAGVKLKINVTYVYFTSEWRRLNILYIVYVHYDYIHLLYIYSTVIITVSRCCFAADPQYLVP